jgi:hypothetical protein
LCDVRKFLFAEGSIRCHKLPEFVYVKGTKWFQALTTSDMDVLNLTKSLFLGTLYEQAYIEWLNNDSLFIGQC